MLFEARAFFMLTIVALWQYQKKKGTQQLGVPSLCLFKYLSCNKAYLYAYLNTCQSKWFHKKNIKCKGQHPFPSYLHIRVHLCSLLWLNSKLSLVLRPFILLTQTTKCGYSVQSQPYRNIHFKITSRQTEFKCIWKTMKYLQKMESDMIIACKCPEHTGDHLMAQIFLLKWIFYMGFTAFRCKVVEGLVTVFP